MNARDEILARLKSQTHPTTLPAPWQSRRQFDDPVERFIASLTKVKGEVFHARTMEDAINQFGELLTALNARSVVYNDEPPVNEINWERHFPEIRFHRPNRATEITRDLVSWRVYCASADVGISSADALLAETGSLVLNSGEGKSRLVTLLPPVHIALVPVARLTTDIFTWMKTHDRKFSANSVLVSGPSKTADIEQTMAVGVHGPKRLIVVLIAN